MIGAFWMCAGGKRVEQIEQIIVRMLQHRRPAFVVAEEGHGDGFATGEIRGTGTAHGQIDPGAERGT